MSHWTQLKVTTRRSLDASKKFSMTKFLEQEASKCTTEFHWVSEEYFSAKTNEVIGDIFYISIRDCINSNSVQDFLEAFINQSPYLFTEITHGVYAY